ncbi:hypothetical protein [Curtobacterium sp. CFBP9011]|nr:hypothetical protein [Curtobacterium sp. CFBP9011]MDY1006323.1 hypothetical protein [Curtobacterium sp. CFBP9011]
MGWYPRLGNGTFTHKANTEPGIGLLDRVTPGTRRTPSAFPPTSASA